MKGLTKTAVTLLAVFGIAACGSDSDSIKFTNLQAVHASADAPLANVWINDEATLTGVDYGVGSGYLMLPEGTNSVQVDVQLPGGDVATVVDKTSLDLDSDTNYTVFVVGDASGTPNPVEPLIVTRSAESMANDDSLDVQVVHAASGVPAVDLYVTAPGADLASSTPLTNLAYKASTDVLNIPAGDYQVRLVAGGNVAFDSGTIPLPANADLTIAAIKTGGTNSGSPVKLLVLDGMGSSIILNTGSKSELRVGHLVDGAPNVDVALDGNVVLNDVMFKDISNYLSVDAGTYNATVDAGLTDPIIDADVTLDSGMSYSVYAVGTAVPLAVEPLVVSDNRRSIATSAVLNVTHAAANPAAASVDVYLTPSQDISQSDPALANFAYKDSAQNVYVTAGDYFVTVTAPGDKTPVIGPAPLPTLENGMVYQAIAIDDNGGFGLLVGDITK
ncbi:DUF4397 domain-containing protein [Vibrio sp. B181a]|uniref:DUF4397 domain-containing protein n=1 Tax=Vibrio sp. B181a TaxID=2835906 RepID=UPI00255344AE|nr:DUF4397 domain-containing protein [Vibrio sp. B181a]MDK9773146.1 DUF4397 domain-containing protein [Vibrio sp. B181a]